MQQGMHENAKWNSSPHHDIAACQVLHDKVQVIIILQFHTGLSFLNTAVRYIKLKHIRCAP